MVRRVLIAAAVYAASGALLFSGFPALVSSLEGLTASLVALLVLCAASLLGPPILLAAGSETFPWVGGILLLFAACGHLSRVCWHRYPDSEVFVFFALPAVMLWTGPGLLLLILLST